MLALFPLLLAILLGVDAQKCSMEVAENATIDRIREIESEPMINIIDLQYNCIATNKRLGIYHSISMSVQYSGSNTAVINQRRFNWECRNDGWVRRQEDISYFNETRSDCHTCTNTTVNDHHCTR